MAPGTLPLPSLSLRTRLLPASRLLALATWLALPEGQALPGLQTSVGAVLPLGDTVLSSFSS